MLYRANCLAVFLWIFIFSSISAMAEIKVGAILPSLAQTVSIQKAKISGAEIEGPDIDFTKIPAKAILLVHWETSCAPCRGEIPALIAIQREFGV
jgi:thiol-disulfide isomerase/thioredoxin